MLFLIRPFLLWRTWASIRRSHRLRIRTWHLQRALNTWQQHTHTQLQHTHIIDTLHARRTRHLIRDVMQQWVHATQQQRHEHQIENRINIQHQHQLLSQAWRVWCHVYITQRRCDVFARHHALSRVLLQWKVYRARKVRMWKAQVSG